MPGQRPGEGSIIGTAPKAGTTVDLVKYSPSSYPTPGFVGNMEYTVMYAGESCGLAHDIKPAAQIVHDLMHEAEAVIEQMQRM